MFSFCLPLCLGSCSLFGPDEPPKEANPKAKGIYEVLIDGESFRANGFSYGIFGANPYVSYTELNGSFVFNILDNENDYSMLINSFESIKDIGFFKLSDYTEYFQNSIDSCKDYYLSHQEDYFVNISKLDIEHDIIEVLSFLN